jgi:alkylation response protein AidB-like acyl-CoA dehydrogenase
MALVRTPDQRLIAETARAFLTEQAGSLPRRRVLEAGQGFDAELWRRITDELGWAAAAIPEAYDGGGLGWADLAVLMEETGRELAQVPFFTTAGLCAPLILQAATPDQAAALLPRLAAGARAAACLTGPAGKPAPEGIAVTLAPDGAGWRLDGRADYVAFGHVADLLVVAAKGPGDGVSLAVVEASTPGVQIERVASLDTTRPYSAVRFQGVRLDAGRVLGAPGGAEAALRRGLAIAAAMLAAEQVGAAERTLEMTRDYVVQRVQFGRPVGAFQAVKHRMADMALWVETARSAAAYAAEACDDPDADLAAASAVARVHCTRALERCAADTIQLHGGIGFTWEHDAHLYFKRARSSATLLGDVTHHQDAVAALIGLTSPESVSA